MCRNPAIPGRIAIDKVGVKDISYPIVVIDKNRKFQHTVARVNLFVDLPHHFKGTHMSRFIEILNRYREEITLDRMEEILGEMKKKLGASSAHLEIDFPYFIEKRAPVSGAKSLMEIPAPSAPRSRTASISSSG